jgi:hypothetical protein
MQDLETSQFIVRKVQDIDGSKRLERLLLSLGLSSSDSSVKETWTPLHPEHSDPYGRVHKTVALSIEV